MGGTETSSLPNVDTQPAIDTAVKEHEDDDDYAVLDVNSRVEIHRHADASAQITADGPTIDDDHRREG